MKDFVKNYFQLSFLISLTVLLVFAGGMNYMKARQGIILTKKPLPMKKPLIFSMTNFLGLTKCLRNRKSTTKM